jgi:hypothetical protein
MKLPLADEEEEEKASEKSFDKSNVPSMETVMRSLGGR